VSDLPGYALSGNANFHGHFTTRCGCGMSYRPVPTMIERLTPIWELVLRRSPIAVDENFFSLGGTLQSADTLFAAIELEFGREMPGATIYHAQTIADLAFLLEQPALPRFSRLVQIKAAREQPPIFIVHGLAGTVPFFELASHLRTAHPVYGLQAKGLDGLEEPSACVEEMAALYLDSIREVQTNGPYVLVGYSFGGLVALEMAQRLTSNREQVALLALVDSYPHLQFLSPGQRLRLVARRAMRIQGIKQRLTRAISCMGRGLDRGWHVSRIRERGFDRPRIPRLSLEHATSRVKENGYIALSRYQPQYYDGKMMFVKSGSDQYYPDNPVAVWAHLAAEFEFEVVPGGHLDMVTTDVESLASVLTRYITAALDRDSAHAELLESRW
jgi:acetoacetyl-CoA synthetase